MTNIIYLSQNHAKNLTTLRSSLRIYRRANTDGRFSPIIDSYTSYYDELMDQVLAR